MPPHKQRKVAVMGFRAVGKSTVTVQFVENQFVEQYNPTIENTFHKVIKYGGEEFGLEIVDTAGQDEYSIFQRQYAVGIHGYVLVYAVTSKTSFEMVKIINEKILNALGTDKVPRVLVGNKKDLTYERQISTEEGQALATKWGCAFVETSAKNDENIARVFLSLTEEIQKELGMPTATEEPRGRCVVM
jgi:Ras family protein